MSLKYVFIALLANLILGAPVENEDATNYKLEDEVMEALEKLRKFMKEGDPENGIPPLEPLRMSPVHFDFYVEDTDIRGHLLSTTIRNLSDFVVKNLTLKLPPKVELGVEVSFDELNISGYYSLFGILFDEYLVEGVGIHKTKLNGLTLRASAILRSKAGVPYIKHLDADFDLDGVSITYKNLLEDEHVKRLEQEVVLHILKRFRTEHLPILLNTLKVVINDTLARDSVKDALPPALREYLNE